MTKNEIHGKLIDAFVEKYKETGDDVYIGHQSMILKGLVDQVIRSTVEDVSIEITGGGESIEMFNVKVKLHGDKEISISGHIRKTGGN